MNLIKISILVALLSVCYSSLFADDSIYFEIWNIDNLETIGGHKVEALGNPQVVRTEIGDAVKFDGDGDQLLIDFNPIMDAKAFTLELLFRPDACYPNNVEPRFVHIQDPNDPKSKRVMIELRVNENNECYMDGFMNTDIANLTLINDSLVHATNVWQHVAITYKDSVFTTYFNGVKELSGIVPYSKQIVNTVGVTSLGARMNNRAYYAGLMKTFKVTHTALEPTDFLSPPSIVDSTDFNESTDSTSSNFLSIPVRPGMKLFPNPVDKYLNLSFSDHKDNSPINIRIINLLGNTIYAGESAFDREDVKTINTSNFKDGIYFLSIKAFNENKTQRFTIIH